MSSRQGAVIPAKGTGSHEGRNHRNGQCRRSHRRHACARAGHDVVFAARDQDEVRHVAENAGAKAATSPAAAVTAADVAILAVPWGAVEDVTNEIRDASDDTVVVDVTNPLTSDYSGLATSGGPSAAETVAKRLPRAHVVKALNTLFGSVQADPKALGTKVDAFYATDDPIARETITELLSSIGFRPGERRRPRRRARARVARVPQHPPADADGRRLAIRVRAAGRAGFRHPDSGTERGGSLSLVPLARRRRGR